MKRLGASLRHARELTSLTGLSAWRAVLNFYDSDNLTHAASIAYYALASLFPFSLIALALLGAMIADASDRDAVLRFVLQFFPEQFDFITRQLDAFRANTLRVGLVGSLILLWGALGVFSAITAAVDHAWGVEKQRSFWKHKLFSFLMLTVAGLALVLALLLVWAAQVISARWFADVLGEFPGLLALQAWTVRHGTTFLFIFVVGLVFYFVPNANVRFRDVWIGAVITGLLWRIVIEGFSWYVRDLTRLEQINGSITAVVVFLLWVYLQAVILLYGVEFTAAYARLRRGRPDEVPAASSPRV